MPCEYLYMQGCMGDPDDKCRDVSCPANERLRAREAERAVIAAAEKWADARQFHPMSSKESIRADDLREAVRELKAARGGV